MTRLMVIIIAAALSAWQGAGPDSASPSGAFSLAAGESRTLQIAATYRPVRLCNDFGSPGPVRAWIGHHLPHFVPPGVCAEDTGDQILLRNESSGTVNGTYR